MLRRRVVPPVSTSTTKTAPCRREGEKLGLACRANAVLTDIVTRVERRELEPDPRHITELRLKRSLSLLANNARQGDDELGECAGLGLDIDPAAMLLDNDVMSY